MSETTKLMAKLTERLADPDSLDDSQKTLMAAIQALNQVLTPLGQPPRVVIGEFTASSEIHGLIRPDFTLPSGAILSDSPDILDLSAAPASRPVTPEIECRPLSFAERAAALLGLTARPVRAAWSQVEEQAGHPISGRDIAAVALSSIFGGPQIQKTGPTGPVILSEQDALTETYLAGLRRDEFGNLLPPDDANLTEADRTRRDEWEAAGGQGQFKANLWDWIEE